MRSIDSGKIKHTTGWNNDTLGNSNISSGKEPITTTMLEFLGAVPFGSRTLNCVNSDNWQSDYDYAILRSTANGLLKDRRYNVELLTTYFKVIPKHGTNVLIKGLSCNDRQLDLLVLEHKEDIEIVRKSVKDIKDLDPILLQNKPYRIQQYQKALHANGWKYRNIKIWAKETFYEQDNKTKPTYI